MKDLTLHDDTQLVLLEHLKTTELLLARAASAASGSEQMAEIIAMPDLGLPHNVRRIHGGFFTGALYRWTSKVPIVPVDATVNVDGASVFRVSRLVNSQREFLHLVNSCMIKAAQSTFKWNFDVGNHFIIYGRVEDSSIVPDGNYAVLHSSASEFKSQHNGLYPSPGNWFSEDIKTIWSDKPNRYLRYIDTHMAERFYKFAYMLEEYSRERQRYFADSLFGAENVVDELTDICHYGMPTEDSVAIGCQWLRRPSPCLLLTAPQRPMYFIRPAWDGANVIRMHDQPLLLYPHGLGKRSRRPLQLVYGNDVLSVNGRDYHLSSSLEDDPSLELRDVPDSAAQDAIPELVREVLSVCPGEVVGRLTPLFAYDRSVNMAEL